MGAGGAGGGGRGRGPGGGVGGGGREVSRGRLRPLLDMPPWSVCANELGER